MKKFIVMSFICSSLLFAQVNKTIGHKEIESKIRLVDLWVNELMDYYKIPGLALGIIYDQELVYSRGYGNADIKNNIPVTDQTLFRIASITKLFTGTAIMKLRDEGKIQLDDPVKKYIPWIKFKNPFKNSEDITIRQLMTHTSGIPKEAAFPYWTDRNFPTMEQIKETVENQEMFWEPGTKFNYSNLGISLLGEIITVVSGIKYDDYISQNILIPLGMSSTLVQIKEDNTNLAVGYLHPVDKGQRVIAKFTDSKGITSAANISTNIQDLAKFVSMQLSSKDNSVLKLSTIREMHRPNWMQPGWKNGWGLTFSTFYNDNQLYVGHGGWISGYRSQILFNTDDKVGVIVLMNAEDFSPSIITDRVYKMAANPLIKVFAEKEQEYKFEEKWYDYTGKYVDSTYWYTEVIVLNDKLYTYDYSYPPNQNPESNLTLLYYESENTFRMKDGNGNKVVFEIGDNGKVKRIKIGENYIYAVNRD